MRKGCECMSRAEKILQFMVENPVTSLHYLN